MSSWNDRTIRFWDVATGEPKATLTEHTAEINNIVFSPDGKTLASCGDNGTIRFWDVAIGELLKVIETEADTIDSAAFSPDVKTLTSTGDNGDDNIRFWDVDTGELLKTITVEAGAYPVVYSPDGKTLASGARDSTIILWDLGD